MKHQQARGTEERLAEVEEGHAAVQQFLRDQARRDSRERARGPIARYGVERWALWAIVLGEAFVEFFWR